MEPTMELAPMDEQPAETKAALEETSTATGQVLNDPLTVGETYDHYDKYRTLRRPYEVQWYISASALRGFPDVRWNADANRLEVKREPAHRKRFRINHIKPKYVARVAKFTRLPPNPTVVPATTDRDDIMNAKASQKALEYFTRKGSMRGKWMQVMQWVPVTGKAFWAIRWNDNAVSHAPTKDDATGKLAPIMGEVELEYCSAFEILPADPGIELMADQPEIIRARVQLVKDVEKRYGLATGTIQGDAGDDDLFFYQRQIADLGTRSQGASSQASSPTDEAGASRVLVIERFVGPSETHPHGRYIVCAGHQLLRKDEVLPGNFTHYARNPYPFIEFCDDAAPGQFWPDAFIERLVGLQSEYNEYRSKLGENLAMHFFPKLTVAKQLAISEDAYTSEAGERINYNWIPGIPAPSFLQPSSVIGDAWNVISMVRKELDDVSHIYPATNGGVGGATSGFQTSLLQEAADQVHGPTIQRNAIALEEAYIKIRHLMKQFYDVPRLVSIAGQSHIPEVYEFSKNTIDEHADIRIEPDTMMPQLRSARIDQIRQMFADGLFGVQTEPATQKRVQDMLRLSFSDFEIERDQRDQEQAQLENVSMLQGKPVPKPQPWEAHQLHYEAHIDLFKSPESLGWSPDLLRSNVFHALIHLCYLNPTDALTMAREFSLEVAVQEVLDKIAPPPAPAPPTTPMPPAEAPPQIPLDTPPQM